MRQTDAIPEATQTAKKQLAAGDISGAEQLLSQQLKTTPQDRETHYYYCVCLRYLNRLPDAKGELEALLITYHGHFFTEATLHDSHRLPLVWSDCRFGSKRPYFRCSGHKCNNMVEHLYSHGGSFLCRWCLNLAYSCQNENKGDRAARRGGKIRIK